MGSGRLGPAPLLTSGSSKLEFVNTNLHEQSHLQHSLISRKRLRLLRVNCGKWVTPCFGSFVGVSILLLFLFNTSYCCFINRFHKWGLQSWHCTLHLLGFFPMHFPARLIQLRKLANYTQQTLSELAELHVNQIRRYEAGTAQPTLEALIRLAKALHVSLDNLVFEVSERGPDEDLRLRFEALSQLDSGERMVVKELLDGMLLKHQARRLAGSPA